MTVAEKMKVKDIFLESAFKDSTFDSFKRNLSEWFEDEDVHMSKDEFMKYCQRFAEIFFAEDMYKLARSQTIPRGFLRNY